MYMYSIDDFHSHSVFLISTRPVSVQCFKLQFNLLHDATVDFVCDMRGLRNASTSSWNESINQADIFKRMLPSAYVTLFQLSPECFHTPKSLPMYFLTKVYLPAPTKHHSTFCRFFQLELRVCQTILHFVKPLLNRSLYQVSWITRSI